MSLLLQFTRVATDYRLANGILQSFPSISTNNPLASFIPLAVVVGIGMIRELITDVKRWQEDRLTNARTYRRLYSKTNVKETQEIKSEDLRPGDIIEIHDN